MCKGVGIHDCLAQTCVGPEGQGRMEWKGRNQICGKSKTEGRVGSGVRKSGFPSEGAGMGDDASMSAENHRDVLNPY